MKPELKLTISLFSLAVLLGLGLMFLRIRVDNEGHLKFAFVAPETLTKFFSQKPVKHDYTIYGYLPYWTLDTYKSLQMDKLTDIAYFGLRLAPDGTIEKKEETDEGIVTESGYLKWNTSEELDEVIKISKKAGVRVALTIISHDDEVSDTFLDCQTCWDTLADSLIAELEKKELTDVNINFEYGDFNEERFDKAPKFVQMCDLINKRLDARFGESKVVVTTFADSVVKDRLTSDVGSLARVTDGIFIMAYDFKTSQTEITGSHAPLSFGPETEKYDLTKMVADYISVAPPKKIIIGLPNYGYNWLVETPEKNAKRIDGSDETGYSEAQPYADIMEILKENKSAIVEWDDTTSSPYVIYKNEEKNTNRVIFFEDAKSLGLKFDLAVNNNLAGIGIWALGYDHGYEDLWRVIGEKF